MTTALNAAPVLDLEKIDQAYDSPPWWYDLRGFFILTFAYRSSLWAQFGQFGRNISGRHLEVAIGSGTLLGAILRWRRMCGKPEGEITGIDYAEAMLAGARERFRGRKNITLLRNDAAALELPDGAFDSANIANAVHCIPSVDRAFAEVYRVLAPGGTMAANVLLYPRGFAPLRWIARRINEWGMRKGILHTPYELEDIRRRIRAAGFEIVRERVAGNTYMVDARKPGSREA